MNEFATIVPDHAAAQATFVEIAFGLNVAFAAYPKLRDTLKHFLDENIEAELATTRLIEFHNKSDGNRIVRLERLIDEIKKWQAHKQERLCSLGCALSCIMSAACLGVLYFDLLKWLGPYMILLLVPFPLYALCAFVIAFRSWSRMHKENKQFFSFVVKFERPSSDSSEIDAIVDRLRHAAEDDERRTKLRQGSEEVEEERKG
jgi:hypothetical protein